MGHFSLEHVLILLLSIAALVGVAAAMIVTLREIGVFGRRTK